MTRKYFSLAILCGLVSAVSMRNQVGGVGPRFGTLSLPALAHRVPVKVPGPLPTATAAAAHLDGIPSPTTEPGHELRIEAHIEAHGIRTTRWQDFYVESHTGQTIEVVGSLAMIHQSSRGHVVSDKLAHWSRHFGQPMTSAAAMQLAMEILDTRIEPLRLALKVLPNAARNDARLVYWVDFDARLVILDAESGEAIHNISKHRTFAAVPKVRVYSAQGLGTHTKKYTPETDTDQIPAALKETCQLIAKRGESKGTPIFIAPDRCTLTAENSVSFANVDEDSIRALKNSLVVAEYYAQQHDRSSFDGRGTEVVNVVHVGDNYDNAFWDEEHNFMAYGDGDGVASASYTRALDIVGHEMTHGITAATAKLIGVGESGALNEAYSDFFGVMIANMKDKSPDWTIGKEIAHGIDGENPGMRSLAQPHQFKTTTFVDLAMTENREVPFPSNMGEKLAIGQECSEKNDQCEVHGNATIPGHASYLIAKALETTGARAENRYDLTAKLYYVVLTQWLASTDGFGQAAKDTLDACKLMYEPSVCAKVTQAFEETGMLGASAQAAGN